MKIMDASYIYEIFKTTQMENAPDLNVGYAMLSKVKPTPDDTTSKEIREFIGKHYDTLVAAYKANSLIAFADAVAACVADDEANAE
jgi:hypothetical protein